MKARILALLTVIVLLVAATVIMTYAETPPDYKADLTLSADNKAVCPACGTEQTWTVLTADTVVPTIGDGVHAHYYVDTSVTNSTVNSTEHPYFMYVTTGSVCLHLGGANDVLTVGANIHLVNAGTVNIMGSGKLLGTGSVSAVKRNGTAINNAASYGNIHIYSGTVASNNATYPAVSYSYQAVSPAAGKVLSKIFIYDDATIQGATNANVIDMQGGKIEMYGGTINGRVLMQSASYTSGGKTYWMKPDFIMHDGTINGVGTKDAPYSGNGGAVYMSYCVFTMNGGTINGGYITGNGAAIGTVAGTNQKQIYIYGGTINGGYSGNTDTDKVSGGGAIYIDGNGASSLSTLTINGNVTIAGGEAAAYGGNILANNTTTTLEGNVVVKDGKAPTGGNIRASGATVMDIKADVLVKDGEATKTGGNISVLEAKVNLYGTVQDGYAASGGGNVIVAGGSCYLYVKGGTVTRGQSGTNGGNIQHNNGSTVISANGVVSDGKALAGSGGNIYSGGGNVKIETSGGTISGGQATGGSGGNIYMTWAASGAYLGKIDILAGTVSGGYTDGNGGNIYAVSKTTVNIAGTVRNLKSELPEGKTANAKNGGNIFISGEDTNLTISGTVDGGIVSALGGNIFLDSLSHTTITTTGTVKNGVATTNGGNIYVCGGSELDIQGSVVNKTTDLPTGTTYHAACGGNIYANGSTAGLTKVTITGTVDGGFTSGHGGNIHFANGAQVDVNNGAVIKNGTANTDSKYGGNIYGIGNSTLNMTGGTISGGYARLAGNIWIEGSAFNMSGGEISGGRSATTDGQDNVRVQAKAVMTMTGGVVYGTNGAAEGKGTAICVFTSGTLRLGGTAMVLRKDGVRQGVILASTSLPRIHILNDWTGEATISVPTATLGIALPENNTEWVSGRTGRLYQAGSVTEGVFTKGGTYAGSLYADMTGKPLIKAKADGTMYISSAQMIKADNSAVWSIDPVADFATGNYKYVKCYGGELTLNGDLVADINGKLITVNGTGKLSAFDSANKNFTATNRGFLTVKGDVQVQPAMMIDGMQYVTLTHNSGNITFHRIEATIKNVALRLGATLDNVGYYYQAVYKFDDMLKEAIDSYGVVLSKINAPGNDFMSEPKGENGWTAMTAPLTSGELVNSGLLKNIMKVSNEAQVNQRNGEMPVFAKPYIVLNMAGGDVTVLALDTTNADGVAMSLKDVLVAIDDYWNNFEDQTVKTRMKEFYSQWASKGMSAWAPELKNMSAAN